MDLVSKLMIAETHRDDLLAVLRIVKNLAAELPPSNARNGILDEINEALEDAPLRKVTR